MKKKESDIPYLRVGTSYFKIIKQPLASKDTAKKIISWSIGNIKEDHDDKNFHKKVPKYDSFCNIPDNINYKRIFDSSYNIYEPIEHEPKEGTFENIELFLHHIFGEQYDIGLDYLTIIWRQPTQILPILCLVSKDRNTGKTTFLNFLKDILGFNMTINTNEDFRNQFNSGWASKLIIGVDEVLLEKKEDTERIKNLSTTKSIKSEAKGKDKIEQEFYGKFILCANGETDFIKISPEEIRFWVRRVPNFKSEIIDLRNNMIKEIPGFLYFLASREMFTKNTTRMWFTREQLRTDALIKVINGGATKLEKEIKNLIAEMLFASEKESVEFIPKDIIELLKLENNVSVSSTDITNIICDKWGYKPVEEPAYYKRFKFYYTNSGSYEKSYENRTGRFYTFKKSEFCEK